MKFIFSVAMVFSFFCVNAQEDPNFLSEEPRYLEDQFYIGITYNFLLDLPTDVNLRNLSYGLQVGFIKDIPLNQDRTFALGIGMGYGAYSYYSNLRASETKDGFLYDILESDSGAKRNKIGMHMVEVPFEIRWRNSTASNYKFWRLYTGIKLAYVAGARSKVVFEDNKDSFYNRDITDFQYGLTLNLGYNTFNLHVYYGLNNLLDSNATLDGEQIKMKPLRFGLIFYIL